MAKQIRTKLGWGDFSVVELGIGWGQEFEERWLQHNAKWQEIQNHNGAFPLATNKRQRYGHSTKCFTLGHPVHFRQVDMPVLGWHLGSPTSLRVSAVRVIEPPQWVYCFVSSL